MPLLWKFHFILPLFLMCGQVHYKLRRARRPTKAITSVWPKTPSEQSIPTLRNFLSEVNQSIPEILANDTIGVGKGGGLTQYSYYCKKSVFFYVVYRLQPSQVMRPSKWALCLS